MTPLTALATTALLLPVIALSAMQVPSNDTNPVAISTVSAPPSSLDGQETRPPTPSAPTGTNAGSVPGERPATARPGRWSWPLSPRPAVARGFVVGPARWSPGHRGVDLATGAGAAVRAPAAGTVHFAGVIAGRPVLSIDHGAGLISSFEPVSTALRRGEIVRQGQVLGSIRTGLTHCEPATCLHWGVRRDGHYINPLLLVPAARGPAVLLPLLPR